MNTTTFNKVKIILETARHYETLVEIVSDDTFTFSLPQKVRHAYASRANTVKIPSFIEVDFPSDKENDIRNRAKEAYRVLVGVSRASDGMRVFY